MRLTSKEVDGPHFPCNARHPLLERNLKPKGIAVVPISVETHERSAATGDHRPEYRR